MKSKNTPPASPINSWKTKKAIFTGAIIMLFGITLYATTTTEKVKKKTHTTTGSFINAGNCKSPYGFTNMLQNEKSGASQGCQPKCGTTIQKNCAEASCSK